MAQTILNVQLAFNGKSPIVAGDERTTSLNLAQLVFAMAHGSRYRNFSDAGPYLQYQTGVVQASGIVTAAAVQAGDTVSVGGTALTATQKRASGTATMSGVAADETLIINGVTFTAVDGAVTPGDATFDCSGTDTQCAASLVTQFDAYVTATTSPLLSGIVGIKSAAAVATVYAINEGTGGNAITLAETGSGITISGATLANGAAPTNNAFDFVGTNAMTAAAIAAAINASTTAAVKQVTATSAAAVCTVTAKLGGTVGNAITWVSSNGTRLAVSGSGTLTGGAADAPVRFGF